MFYKCGMYPNGAIAKVSFFWKPKPKSHNNDPAENIRTLWIWSHPSSYQQVYDELCSVFSIEGTCSSSKVSVDNKLTRSDDIAPGKGNFYRRSEISKLCNKARTVTIIPLKDSIVRFRLTGPQSHAILSDLLKPIESIKPEDFPWFDEIPLSNYNDVLMKQKENWMKMAGGSSPSIFPPHSVISLLVKDPRLGMPQKRTKKTSNINGMYLNMFNFI